MKKMIIVLLAMVVLSGCATTSNLPNLTWHKEGPTKEQEGLDRQECYALTKRRREAGGKLQTWAGPPGVIANLAMGKSVQERFDNCMREKGYELMEIDK